ncbi:SMODS domain-containing nucleotidyltransferase [Nocardiopsis sp. NPDC055551]
MRHVDYFKNFLDNTVNLSKFKLETLSGRVDAIYDLLKADEDLGPLLKKKIPQGSWPQRTIINPQNGKAFDGDFMVQMVKNPEWDDDLKKYGDAIYNVLHKKSPYKDMPHGRKCRCIYVQYANNAMHVDIVPFVVDSDDKQWIINRDDNEWERTDTQSFTDWMKKKDKITHGNLRKVIRIMKFLRDHKKSFTGTKSILLTTMLGERVEEWQNFNDPGYYGDLPTALLHIISDLDKWLQANTTKPVIMDPSGSGTSFDHRWTPETYSYFRDRIHTHAAEIRDAYFEDTDFDKSVKKWQALFGNGFKEPETSTSSGKYSSIGAGSASVGATTVNHSGRAG